jgi:hypothetical protein
VGGASGPCFLLVVPVLTCVQRDANMLLHWFDPRCTYVYVQRVSRLCCTAPVSVYESAYRNLVGGCGITIEYDFEL